MTCKLKLHGLKCWVAGYGAQDSVDAMVYGTKKSVGLYFLNRSYCLNHRKYWKNNCSWTRRISNLETGNLYLPEKEEKVTSMLYRGFIEFSELQGI